MPFFELKKKISERVVDVFKHPEITADSIRQELSAPPNIQMGHVALPCFRLSKILKKSSNDIAKELAASLSGNDLTVTVAGPYANFKQNAELLYQGTLSRIFAEKDRYGSDVLGNGKRICLEYCSPNIAKKLAFQHIRSTLIGNTLANIYDFMGYQTERINFVGDWGTQFARLLAAVDKWGDKAKLDGNDMQQAMDHLFELYVRFHKEVDTHPEYLELASGWLQRLEEGEARATEVWKRVRAISIASMDIPLKRMSIRFNHIEGESHYISQIKSTLDEVKAKAGAHLSDGAWIVDVEGLKTPALVQKRDGTTLYLTRDIAAAADRFQRFDFEKMFYVVSEQQKLHFQLLFGVLKKMGKDWADRCEHLSFGTVLFGKEKMSTREGRVIFLDDLLNEARQLALVECTQKNPDLPNKEEVAEMVGIGAIIFGELSAHKGRDIEFDWKEILALEGDTGPYVQYSLVRCTSLLAKAGDKGEYGDTTLTDKGYEFSSEEEQLVLTLSKFRSVLHQATRENEPYHLTYYLIDVAKNFNRFYYRFPVLQATDPIQRRVRLNLVRGTEQTLVNGLTLLGIQCPKEM